MYYKRITLALIVGGECIISCFLGYKVYSNIKQRNNVLGATIVTPLKKEFLIFPENSSYSAYFEPKPNTVETESYPWMATSSATYTINADGLNDVKNYTVMKPPGTYRIIALGDSFTFGHYVNTPLNWSSLLEDKLNENHNTCPTIQNYEVLNLGVRGYDIDFAAERYRLHGQKYNPDLVIWFINNHHFFMVRQLITAREQEIGAHMSKADVERFRAQGNFFPANQQAMQEMFQKYPMERLVEQEKAGLYDFASRYGGPLVIVANNIDDKYIALLNTFKNFRTAPTYIFKNISDVDSITGAAFPDGHPTVAGHQLYATDIYNYLTNNHLIACQ